MWAPLPEPLFERCITLQLYNKATLSGFVRCEVSWLDQRYIGKGGRRDKRGRDEQPNGRKQHFGNLVLNTVERLHLSACRFDRRYKDILSPGLSAVADIRFVAAGHTISAEPPFGIVMRS